MRTLEERFWEKVDKRGADECWLWKAGHNGRYGVLGLGRRGEGQEYAHRISWRLGHGAPAGDMDVCHTCDVTMCVNPAHLFLGTRSDNMKDCAQKKRARGKVMYGSENPASKIDRATAELVRFLNPIGARQSDLAEWFGVHQTTISKVVRREIWV